MAKLTDTQRILLSTAAQRDDGSLMPIPDTISESTFRVRKAFAGLIKALLAEEGVVQEPALAWRQEGDTNIGARITGAGRAAIGVTDGGADIAALPTTPGIVADIAPKQTKVALVLTMLQREEGATLGELVAATSWLPHTTRAALTGLRKKGHAISKAKRHDATCYNIGGGA